MSRESASMMMCLTALPRPVQARGRHTVIPSLPNEPRAPHHRGGCPSSCPHQGRLAHQSPHKDLNMMERVDKYIVRHRAGIILGLSW
ncbi:hypothetical protein B0H15DRAFT_552816 [Mycena belliarum]|uniref:Uncharacterized protein n=1 Tax=Mycena belliarum TaxID=1033014 RepID=A0AAD6UKA8_9AGAR|nr:hypothetical protein B0H15DRAFT_552816 [Mycena belliae]